MHASSSGTAETPPERRYANRVRAGAVARHLDVDALLAALFSARGRSWLISGLPGAVAFLCLGALALGGLPLAVHGTTRCTVPDPAILCDISNHGEVRFLALTLLCVLGLIAGMALVAALTGPVLGLIAGLGWPGGRPFARLIKRSCGWHRRRRERLLAEFRAGGGAAARLAWYPTGDAGIRPSRAGNAFAALGQRIRRRHGLDLSACWPLIEQTLSQPARERLEQASSRVAGRVQNLLWTIAAVLWLPAFPVGFAVVIAVIGAVLAALLWWAVGAAVEQYCALIEASVATNRRAMYVAIGWPPPMSTKQEPDHGRALTGYLTRLSGWGDVDLEWPNDAGA